MESKLPPKQSASYPHDDWISSISLHSDKPLMITGCYDGLARIWNHSGSVLATLSGHSKPIKSVHWLPNTMTSDHGLYCFSASDSILCHSLSNDGSNPMKPMSSEVMFECVGHQGSIECMTLFDQKVRNELLLFIFISLHLEVPMDPSSSGRWISIKKQLKVPWN